MAFAIKEYEFHHCVGLAIEVIEVIKAQMALTQGLEHF